MIAALPHHPAWPVGRHRYHTARRPHAHHRGMHLALWMARCRTDLLVAVVLVAAIWSWVIWG